MKFAFDTEFVDTPNVSELISIGFAAEDGRTLYCEFGYWPTQVTPWLKLNVVPLLGDPENWVNFADAESQIRNFVGGSKFERPEFWAYYGAYDWYWLSRIFGGMLLMPEHWPHRFKEFAEVQQGVPNLYGPEHHALNDANSLLHAMRLKGLARART